MILPFWSQFVEWQKPHSLAELIANPDLIPGYQGFYAFNEDPGELRRDHVLYIGETGRRDGFKGRFATYLSRNPRVVRTRHKAANLLLDYRTRVSSDQRIYLRWAPLEIDKVERREIEAALIQHFLPRFNTRDREAYTSYG